MSNVPPPFKRRETSCWLKQIWGRGLVAQLVEQRPFKPFVQGSSPCQPTTPSHITSQLIAVIQLYNSLKGSGTSQTWAASRGNMEMLSVFWIKPGDSKKTNFAGTSKFPRAGEWQYLSPVLHRKIIWGCCPQIRYQPNFCAEKTVSAKAGHISSDIFQRPIAVWLAHDDP